MRRRSLITASTAALIPLSGCLFLLDGDDGGGDGGNGSGGTPTPEPERQFQGPTSEDNGSVDLQYRDYSEDEISEMQSNAGTIAYDDLLRDIESYVGDPVHYTGVITQVLEGEEYFVFQIAIDSDADQLVFASWTGDRFIREDVVEIYAEVLGPETYQTARGDQRTIPGFAIAAMELIEE